MEGKTLAAMIPFILALILSLATLPPEGTITYDGALYINVARNLVTDSLNFTYQGIYMMYRPPLYPYTLSILYHFVHDPLNQLLVARLISAFFFSLTAVIVYLLALELFGERWKALAASMLYILNPLAFTMGTRELVHSEFTFFYTLAVYLLYTGRKRNSAGRIYLSFVSAGFAILTRYTGLSIIAVFFTYLWLVDHWEWVKKRDYWLGALLLLLTLSPWLYMGHINYGGALRPFSVASKVVTLDRPVSVSDYIGMLFEDLGVVIPLLAILGFLRLRKDENGWLILSWIVIGGFGILSVTHKETRFVTFLTPALAILGTEGVHLIANVCTRFFEHLKKRSIPVAWVLLILLLVPISNQAIELKEQWNKFGLMESEVMEFVTEYHPKKLLVPPRLYTIAGFYCPDADVDMTIEQDAPERIMVGYYDVIIGDEESNLDDRYLLVKEFHGGKFKVYLRKEN